MLSVAACCAGIAFFALFVPSNAADAVLWRIAEAATEVGIDDPAAVVRAAREAGLLT